MHLKSRIIISVGVSVALATGAASAVVAEEGSFTRAADAFSRAITQAFQTEDYSNQEELVAEDVEFEPEEVEPEPEEIEPEPITYPNGFTEGELDDNGTPRFSSEEFVPEGLREAEVDFCATADDYEKCQDYIFQKEWHSQAPEGPGWREIRFGDAPLLWVNDRENITKWHNKTEMYLQENMHLHVTGIKEPYINGDYLVWNPRFELDNQNFFYNLNSQLESSKVTMIYETSGGSETYSQGTLSGELGVSAKNLSYLRIGLGILPKCTEGNLYLQIVTPPSANSISMTSGPKYFSNISQSSCQEFQPAFSIEGGSVTIRTSPIGSQLFDVDLSASVEMQTSDFTDIAQAKLLIARPEGAGIEVSASVSQTAANSYQIRANASKELLLQQGNHTIFLSVAGSNGAGDLVRLTSFGNNGTGNKVDASLP